MPEGIPFSLTQGDTPTLADLTVGGKTSGAQQGLSLYWTLAQIVGVDHTTTPVSPIGGAITETLGRLFSISPIAAAAGITQASATPIVAATTIFVSVNPNAGAVLPEARPASRYTIFVDADTNDMLVWPADGNSILSLPDNDPVMISSGGNATFVCNVAGTWKVG